MVKRKTGYKAVDVLTGRTGVNKLVPITSKFSRKSTLKILYRLNIYVLKYGNSQEDSFGSSNPPLKLGY